MAASVQEIFDDAHQLYGQAITTFDAGDVRDAAEKAWYATKRATDALILARRPGGSRKPAGKLPRNCGT